MTVGHNRPKVNFDEIVDTDIGTPSESKSGLVGRGKIKTPETYVSGVMGLILREVLRTVLGQDGQQLLSVSGGRDCSA